jgi:hypothetical protein
MDKPKLTAVKNEPNVQVIELLTSLLERAKSGESMGIVYIEMLRGGQCSSGAKGEVSGPETIYALEMMKWDIFNSRTRHPIS